LVGLATSTPANAKTFYTRLFGWQAEDLTPLDAAARSGATRVLTWLHAHGA
jgi:predicted enzyme related to lactoylglutathione lyase